MLQALLATWLTAAPSAPPVCQPRPTVLGADDASLRVVAYLDPVHRGSHTAWLELRRLAAEYRGQLRIEVRMARAARQVSRTLDHVRKLVMAATDAGHLEAALATVDRDGTDRVHARLHDRSAHATLAQDLGLPVARIRKLQLDPCLRRRLNITSAKLHHPAPARSQVGSPFFEVDGTLRSGTSTLSRLRPDLAGLAQKQARERRRKPSRSRPSAKGVSEALVRPWPDRGVLVGGPGLAHHILVLARDESDPNLLISLPLLMAHRAQFPGSMSLQVVAHGRTQMTEDLRRRLCAARRLGREMDYLRYLASDRSGDRVVLGPANSELLERLERAAETCEEPAPDLDHALSGGPWIDGTPRSQGELESLPTTLRVLESAHAPLSPLLGEDQAPEG